MTKQEIIEHIARQPKYLEICRVVTSGKPSHLADDLYQDIFIFLCEMPEARLQSLYAENFDNFYFGIAARQVRSPSSRFHKVNIKHLEFLRKKGDDIAIYHKIFPADRSAANQDLIRRFRLAMSELEQSDYAAAKLLELYSERVSIKQVAIDSNIPLRSVYKIIENARENIKLKIQRYKRMKK